MSQRIHDLPLRAALKRLLLLAVSATLGVLVLSFFVLESTTGHAQLASDLRPLAAVTAENLAAPVSFNDRPGADVAIAALERDPRFRAIVVVLPDGQTWLMRRSDLYPSQVIEPNWLQNRDPPATSGVVRLKHSINAGAESVGDLLLFFAPPPLHQRLLSYLPHLAAVGVALTVMALLVFRLLHNGIIRPARELADRARALAGPRAETDAGTSRNEIAQLRDDIGHLLEALVDREAGLRGERLRLQLAMASVDFGVWELQMPAGELQLDEKTQSMLGLNPVAVSATPGVTALSHLLDHLDVGIAHHFHEGLFRMHLGQQNFQLEAAYYPPGQPARHLQWFAQRSPESGQHGSRIVGVVRNVTQDVSTRARLEQREHELRTIVEHAPFAMATNTPDGTITQINRAFVNLFGYRPEQLDNLDKWWPLAYPDERYREHVRTEWLRYVEGARRNPEQTGLRTRVRCADGRNRDVLFFVSLPSPELAVTCCIDDTERLRAERAMAELNASLEQRVRLRTEELEIANRELEGFSYSVSHDLRAPLRAISGFGQALEEDYRSQMDTVSQSYLDRILAAANRMGMLIDDLLRFSRLSRTAMRMGRVDLRLCIQQCWAETPQHDAVLLQLQEGIWPACLGDEPLLRQVFLNLMSNAVKFSRHVAAPCLQIGIEVDAQSVQLRFADNGAGFDMSYADKLFGVFQRLHKQDEFEGTGVGLALCRRIVERHGGSISAESAPGKGARFYVRLPLASEAPPQSPQTA